MTQIIGKIVLPTKYVNLGINERATLRLTGIKDKAGQIARIDGNPAWTVQNDDELSIEPIEDGMACEIMAQNVGQATVTVLADGRIGEEEKLIERKTIVTILPDDAVEFDVFITNVRPKDHG